jgi:hypothetical protein
MPISRRLESIPVSSTCIILSMASLIGAMYNINNLPSATSQENNSNIASGLQLGNITNMSGATDKEQENATQIKNITEVSNATSGEAIPLQQIVTLRDSASESVFNNTVNEVKSKGAEILYTYNQLNSFAFRAPNNQVLTDIVTGLKNNPSVSSVTTDRSAGIMPE